MSDDLFFDDEGLDIDPDEDLRLLDDDFSNVEQTPSQTIAAGLKEPRESSLCVGFDDIEKLLITRISDGNLPHAIIFTGIEGIGKSTFAYRLSRYLLKYGLGEQAADSSGGLFGAQEIPQEFPNTMDININDRVFRQVASQGHPDIITVQRAFDEKKEKFQGILSVDEVRKINPFMRMTASSAGGVRIAIIDDADTMNRNAQNAVLKILEEPPESAFIFLIAHRMGAFLPTIRSRCHIIQCKSPTLADFTTVLRTEYGGIDQTQVETLYDMCSGSIGQALQIMNQGGAEAIQNVVQQLYHWPEWPWPQIHLLAENLSRKGQEDSYDVFCNVFLWAVRRMVDAKARNENPKGILKNEATRKIIEMHSLTQLTALYDDLQSHFNQIEHANLDKKQGILGAFGLFNTVKKLAA